MGSLRSLRRLELEAPTNSTADLVHDFVNKLDAGNKGLVLSLKDADVEERDISRGEQEWIQKDDGQKVRIFSLNICNYWHDGCKNPSVTPTSPNYDTTSTTSPMKRFDFGPSGFGWGGGRLGVSTICSFIYTKYPPDPPNPLLTPNPQPWGFIFTEIRIS